MWCVVHVCRLARATSINKYECTRPDNNTVHNALNHNLFNDSAPSSLISIGVHVPHLVLSISFPPHDGHRHAPLWIYIIVPTIPCSIQLPCAYSFQPAHGDRPPQFTHHFTGPHMVLFHVWNGFTHHQQVRRFRRPSVRGRVLQHVPDVMVLQGQHRTSGVDIDHKALTQQLCVSTPRISKRKKKNTSTLATAPTFFFQPQLTSTILESNLFLTWFNVKLILSWSYKNSDCAPVQRPPQRHKKTEESKKCQSFSRVPHCPTPPHQKNTRRHILAAIPVAWSLAPNVHPVPISAQHPNQRTFLPWQTATQHGVHQNAKRPSVRRRCELFQA